MPTLQTHITLLISASLFLTGCNNNLAKSPDSSFIKIDNENSLIIGLYEYPDDENKLTDAANAGFNLIHSSPDAAQLDKINSLGLKAWISLDLNANSPQKIDNITTTVNSLKNHPALLIWEAPDEILWYNWYPAFDYFSNIELKQMKQIAESTDPSQARLLSQYQKVEDALKRALWQNLETERQKFWHIAQQSPQNPNLKISDALQNSQTTLTSLTEGVKTLKSLDPNHPVWLNHAPRNSLKSLTAYNIPFDIVGCDIYPIPHATSAGHSDLISPYPSCVGLYTDRMIKSAPNKSCFMILQGFNWKSLNELSAAPENPDQPQPDKTPNLRETRFMAHNALMHGANAIIYWGTFTIDRNSQLWKDILQVASELRSLEPAILAPQIAPTVISTAHETLNSIDPQDAPLVQVKKVGPDFFIFAANETISPVPFTISNLPHELEGKTLYRLYTHESHTIKNLSLTDGIRPFDIHIYTTQSHR